MISLGKPPISVCVPTYNGAVYLGECLESILSQSFGDFEIVLVDDCSSDDSAEIARGFADRDCRVSVIHNPKNLGLVRNWQRCVELAKGDWIKFVFQDDYIEHRCLEGLLKVAHLDIPIVACRRSIVFDGVSPETREWYENYLNEFSFERLFPGKSRISAKEFCAAAVRHFGWNFVGEPTAVLLHRDVFQRFGKFNEKLLQLCDFEFWARVASQTGMVYVPEPLATFRVHQSSTTADNETRRAFRAGVLDEVILLHEYIYRAEFASLRKTARSSGINLRQMLAQKVYWTQKRVGRGNHNGSDADRVALEDWNSLVACYPNLLASWRLKRERGKDLLDRYILWRFRQA